MHLSSRPLAWFCVLFALGVTMAAQVSPADIDRKGPQVGARVPAFSGVDQFGNRQTLETTLKADGAMLVFFRSADW